MQVFLRDMCIQDFKDGKLDITTEKHINLDDPSKVNKAEKGDDSDDSIVEIVHSQVATRKSNKQNLSTKPFKIQPKLIKKKFGNANYIELLDEEKEDDIANEEDEKEAKQDVLLTVEELEQLIGNTVENFWRPANLVVVGCNNEPATMHVEVEENPNKRKSLGSVNIPSKKPRPADNTVISNEDKVKDIHHKSFAVDDIQQTAVAEADESEEDENIEDRAEQEDSKLSCSSAAGIIESEGDVMAQLQQVIPKEWKHFASWLEVTFSSDSDNCINRIHSSIARTIESGTSTVMKLHVMAIDLKKSLSAKHKADRHLRVPRRPNAPSSSHERIKFMGMTLMTVVRVIWYLKKSTHTRAPPTAHTALDK